VAWLRAIVLIGSAGLAAITATGARTRFRGIARQPLTEHLAARLEKISNRTESDAVSSAAGRGWCGML
jgi:hypothetical protein